MFRGVVGKFSAALLPPFSSPFFESALVEEVVASMRGKGRSIVVAGAVFGSMAADFSDSFFSFSCHVTLDWFSYAFCAFFLEPVEVFSRRSFQLSS